MPAAAAAFWKIKLNIFTSTKTPVNLKFSMKYQGDLQIKRKKKVKNVPIVKPKIPPLDY